MFLPFLFFLIFPIFSVQNSSKNGSPKCAQMRVGCELFVSKYWGKSRKNARYGTHSSSLHSPFLLLLPQLSPPSLDLVPRSRSVGEGAPPPPFGGGSSPVRAFGLEKGYALLGSELASLGYRIDSQLPRLRAHSSPFARSLVVYCYVFSPHPPHNPSFLGIIRPEGGR